jgi:hypothetical protein
MQTLFLRSTKKKRIANILVGLVVWLMLLFATGWGAMALWLNLALLPLRLPIVVGFVAGMLLPLILLHSKLRALAVSGVLFIILLLWFFSLVPENHREWQTDQAVLPWAEIVEGKITLHNIRNCDYRTETDFTCQYSEQTYDIAALQTLDLFLVYWGSPYIAHTMLSFGFTDGEQVCFSIETRKEVGEEYSAIKGFFRQYEKIYVVADERDVVRLRTNFRKEDVYLYPLQVKPEMARLVFLDYLGEVNRLSDRPEWYNALTGNCTTSIRRHTRPYNPDGRLDWRMIVNGYLDQMIYERGFLGRDLPLNELREQSYINPKAHAAGESSQFSALIREGLKRVSP